MTENTNPKLSKALADKRRALAPEADEVFRNFSKTDFRDGALSGKAKQPIAVAVAHVTQCTYCIEGHTRAAVRDGATPEEIMEAIWVADFCKTNLTRIGATNPASNVRKIFYVIIGRSRSCVRDAPDRLMGRPGRHDDLAQTGL